MLETILTYKKVSNISPFDKSMSENSDKKRKTKMVKYVKTPKDR